MSTILPNPKPRRLRPLPQNFVTDPAQRETVQVIDAFQNVLARVGWGTDNLMEGTAYPLTRLSRNYVLMQSLYRSNWIARKIIDCVAEDMLKNWIQLLGEQTPEEISEFDKVVLHTLTQGKILDAISWARLFGGAAAVMIIKGHSGKLDKPLKLEDVPIDSYRGLIVLDRWSGINPSTEITNDIDDPVEFGLPEYYNINTEQGRTYKVHSSRVLRFMGRKLPNWEWQAEQRWGISEFEVIFEELKKRDNTSYNLASLIFRANIIALKQKDLSQMLSGLGASAEAAKRFQGMLQAQTQLMSNQGLIVLPEEGGLETHQYGFNGINDVYNSFMMDMCGAAEIPMTRLFGRTQTGLGQSNAGDEHNYYDMIGQKQKRELDPQLRKLLPVIAMSTWGEVPDDFDWKYEPVRTMTNEEQAELATKKTECIDKVFNSGIIGRKTALIELQQLGDEVNIFTNITDEAIDEAEDEPIDPMGEMGMDPMGPPDDGSATDLLLGNDGEEGEEEPPAKPNGKANGKAKAKKSKAQDEMTVLNADATMWQESKHKRKMKGKGGGQFSATGGGGGQSPGTSGTGEGHRVRQAFREKHGQQKPASKRSGAATAELRKRLEGL